MLGSEATEHAESKLKTMVMKRCMGQVVNRLASIAYQSRDMGGNCYQ